MRTNGFAFFRGPDSRAAAEEAAGRMERYGRKSLLSVRWGSDGQEGRLLSFSLDEGPVFPVVHGFAGVAEGGSVTGEFAMLGGDPEDGLVASRDGLGTRPLYYNESGSTVASDHRVFGRNPRLLPNGASLEMNTMKVGSSALPKVRVGETLEECAGDLAALLVESVRKRVGGRKRVAVSFSGGLDSSLLAVLASRSAEVVLCSVYSAGSRDEKQVRSAADALGLELVATEMDRASVSRELRTLDLPFAPTPMDKALWCIYTTTARQASQNGAELIVLGQLADELFGGYMKYARAAAADEASAARMMERDVLASGERAFLRDEAACGRYSEVRFPFADEGVASYGLSLPVGYKVRAGERKVVLRMAAALMGLPESLTDAPKKAAQYSSGIAKLVP